MPHVPEGMVLAPESFFDEDAVLVTTRKWKWLSLKVGNFQLFAMNWVVSVIASIVLLGFVIASVADGAAMERIFRFQGQPWVTQNFTWLYILTQDVWVVFLI